MVSIAIPKKTALPIPSFFPIAGAKREKVAKVNKGSVVKKPAKPFESPRSSLIKGIKGPTDAIEVLRLIEIKRIPVINSD
jgi:hypothetical protein